MIRALFLLFIFNTKILLFASDYEARLIQKVLNLLFNKPIKVYIEKNEILNGLEKKPELIIVNRCENADVVIAEDYPKECGIKPFFALNYRSFNKSKYSIAAFYWRYGRPQLFFKEKGLKYFRLKLPKKYQRYLR